MELNVVGAFNCTIVSRYQLIIHVSIFLNVYLSLVILVKYVLGGDLHFACTFLKIEDKSSLQKLFYRRSLVISLVESNGIVWLMQIDELSVSYLVRHLLKLPSTDSSSDGCGSASSVHTPQPTAPYISLSISHCVLPARSRAACD